MKKIAAAAALAACCLTAPQAATAGLYKFQVDSIACYDPSNDCRESFSWIERLESLRIWTTAYTPSSSISVTTLGAGLPWEESSYQNQGVINIFADAFGLSLDNYYQRCKSSYFCEISGAFSGEWALDSGFLRLASYDSDLFMESGGDGLWTGWLTSDRGPTPYPLELSGRWFSVPEPSPVVLIGAGLAGLIAFRRRKDTRQQA